MRALIKRISNIRGRSWVRSEWTNLNGLWEYAILPRGENHPAHYHGSILVPFPVESALSGVMQRLGPEKSLWYRRRFTVPAAWRGQQVLLHFEAVDWETGGVRIDGKELTTSDPHRGGYSPFAFDITDTALAGSEHELVVGVLDPRTPGSSPAASSTISRKGLGTRPAAESGKRCGSSRSRKRESLPCALSRTSRRIRFTASCRRPRRRGTSCRTIWSPT